METLFLGVAVPDAVAEALVPMYDHYGSVVETREPREKMHLTLLWLGDAAVPAYMIKKLLKPLPQSFVPTVRLTHVGRGRQRHQLWAYAEAAGPIVAIREQLQARLAEIRWHVPKQEPRHPFAPHITVAALYEQVSHIGVADYPLVTSFAVHDIPLYRSTPQPKGSSVYSVVGTISLI